MYGTIVVRGGGDLASGVAHRLFRAGFGVILLELPEPTNIRRAVAFGSAVYEEEIEVEGVKAKRANTFEEIGPIMTGNRIPVFIDPRGESIKRLKPLALVDCIMAKANIGTGIDMAPVVIGVGPGFTAGEDVHAVIESKRGHFLGKVIYSGRASENTGIPGEINGYNEQRVMRACGDGIIVNHRQIGELVSGGDIISSIGDMAIRARIGGALRGLIYDGSPVYRGMKIGDIDPRGEAEYCYTISDKARAIGGGVLEALLNLDKSGMLLQKTDNRAYDR